MSTALRQIPPIYEKKRRPIAVRATDLIENFRQHRLLYLFLLPGVLYFVIFHYIPLGGLVIAFKDYNMMKGFLGSEWVGFHHFIKLFSTSKFYQVFWNTLVINFYKTLFFFPVPILISLLLNEIHSTGFKRSIQSVLYFPHFLSWVVVAGFVFQFLRPEGPLNSFVATLFGMEPVNFIAKPEYFRPILVVTAMWRETGWATILYMAQLSTIDPQLYEAAYVDGAPRWRQMLHISLPGIMPIVAITLILRLGRTMIIGYEQVLVLYNPMVYDVGDVIQTYIYRTGLLNARFSFAAACGIFQGIVAFILLWASNKLSNRVSGHGIW